MRAQGERPRRTLTQYGVAKGGRQFATYYQACGQRRPVPRRVRRAESRGKIADEVAGGTPARGLARRAIGRQGAGRSAPRVDGLRQARQRPDTTYTVSGRAAYGLELGEVLIRRARVFTQQRAQGIRAAMQPFGPLPADELAAARRGVDLQGLGHGDDQLTLARAEAVLPCPRHLAHHTVVPLPIGSVVVARIHTPAERAVKATECHRSPPVSPAGELVAAAAGARLAAVSRRLEAVAAAAARHRHRVVDGEAGAHQAIHIVHFAAGDVARAHLVHQQTDALDLRDDIAILRLVERHAVLEAGAAAPSDKDAQAKCGVALLFEKLTHLLGRRRGQADERLLSLDHVCHENLAPLHGKPAPVGCRAAGQKPLLRLADTSLYAVLYVSCGHTSIAGHESGIGGWAPAGGPRPCASSWFRDPPGRSPGGPSRTGGARGEITSRPIRAP